MKLTYQKSVALWQYSVGILLSVTFLSAVTLLLCVPLKADAAKHVAGIQKTWIVDDRDRPFDEFGGINTGPRFFITHIYYPVKKSEARKNIAVPFTWLDFYAGNKSLCVNHQVYIFGGPLTPDPGETVQDLIEKNVCGNDTLDSTSTGSFKGKMVNNKVIPLPVDKAKGPFPLIILAPGLTGPAYEVSLLAKSLAESGYIVVTWDIPGENTLSPIGEIPNLNKIGTTNVKLSCDAVNAPMSEDCQVENLINKLPLDGVVYWPPIDWFGLLFTWDKDVLRQFYDSIDKDTQNRISDVVAIIRELNEQNNNPESLFNHAIDLSKIGMSGYSLGGTQTIAMRGIYSSDSTAVNPLWDLPSNIDIDAYASLDTAPIADSRGWGDEIQTSTSRVYFPIKQQSDYGLHGDKPVLIFQERDSDAVLGAAGYMYDFSVFFDLDPPMYAYPVDRDPDPDSTFPYGTRKPIVTSYYNAATTPAFYMILPNGRHSDPIVGASTLYPDNSPTEFYNFFGQLIYLYPAETTHNVINTVFKDFFDWTLKGKKSSKNKLKSSRFKALGLDIEYK